ncbi:MAG: hypothetical protein ACE5F5_11920 [Acidimicrobiia bacterium]
MPNPSDIADRAAQLKKRHQSSHAIRQRVRAILNGGVGAVQALLGSHVSDEDLPWPNLMVSGLTRLAQKVGDVPVVTAPSPTTTNSQRARKRAEKRERIIESYDRYDRLELQLPQVGRWLPGYGFSLWTIEQGLTPDGDPYPRAAIRDPYDVFPGDWGSDQQPREVAIFRRVNAERLKYLYPEKAPLIDKLTRGADNFSWTGGGVLLEGGNWEGSSRTGIVIVEYLSAEGVSVVTSDGSILLDHIPNPLDSVPFVVPKRFAFDQLTGQYDHIIGLMAAMAKINILGIIAMEDAVFSPVNIFGQAPKPRYRRGRFAVNVMPPGTEVRRDVANLPYQLFEQINRIERQFRLVSGYSVTDDAQSPLSFATGRGLEELNTAITQEVREYHKVLKYALQDLDSKRLEWDQKLYGTRKKPLVGERKGVRFSETYIPNRDIAGDYLTQRKHGVFAGFDKTESIIVALQLLDAELLDPLTAQESIVGLADLDHTQINERIRSRNAERLLTQVLAATAQQGDPRALLAFIDQLPEGDVKNTMLKYFSPEGPQPTEAEAAALNPTPEGPPPDVQTVLRRLALSGPAAGVQTVGRGPS